MFGAAAAGESHSRIAKALDAKDTSTVFYTINRIYTRKTGVTGNRRRGKYKTTSTDEHHFVVSARKYPEAKYWDIILRAGLEIIPRICKKVLQRFYLGNWLKAQLIISTEEYAQIRREFAEKYSRPEELQHFMRGLFSDECTIRNSPDNPGQWVFRLASESSDRISWTPKAIKDLLFPLWCGLWCGNKVVKGVLQSWCFAKGIRISLGEE
jgi:hypothetical protein